MNERFQFLRTYAESINELAKADENLANGLTKKIIQYGIYWINEDSWSPIIEAMFVQIKVMIDKGQDLTEKRRNANQKRTNIQQKQNKNEQNLTNSEQNLTNGQQTAPKDKIENRKDKKENIVSLSNDNEEDKTSYGNEEINKCLELIKQYNNGIVDWTKVNQRRFGKHLINKLKELDSIKDWRFTREQTLEIILKVVSQNKYYSWKICSPEQIYRNLSLLMNVCKNDISKTNADNVVLQAI